MVTPSAEYEQILRKFFYELEEEFHDSADCETHRWRQERYKLWTHMGSRKQIRSMEHWFKGEIAVFLDNLQNAHHLITVWDCEFPSGTGKIDYWISFGEDFPPLALEVKCSIEGVQGKGKTSYTANMEEVAKDLKKSMPDGAQLYCLLFIYPPPSEKRLQAFRKSLNFHAHQVGIDAKISWKDPYYVSSGSGLYIGKVELSRI